MLQEQDISVGFKLCPRCKKQKPLTEFYRIYRGRDVTRSYCKECTKEYNAIRYAENKEHFRQYSKARYTMNRDRVLIRSKHKYYNTDYLDKKYLKRYRASLEKVLTKKANLENTTEWKENPTNKMKHKMFGYELAISSWNNKIRETEKRIEIYSKKHKEIIL